MARSIGDKPFREGLEDLNDVEIAGVILIEDTVNGSPLVADLRYLNEPGIPTALTR